MDAFIATILMFGGNFAPRNWAFCNGQLLSISQNIALFSLLGTTYGGDGVQTFALPNLQGRVPIHWGQGAGLSNYTIGQADGLESNTLLLGNLPAHNHAFHAVSELGTTSAPSGAYLGNTGALDREYGISGTLVTMNDNVVGATGSGTAFSILQPYLAVTYIICLEGIFPSRN